MGKRTIVLVRHGHYLSASEDRPEKLTELGRRQAKMVAKRLKDFPIDRIIHSTMPRAIETAAIIKRELKYRSRFESCDSLRECVPGFPKHLRKKRGFTDEKILKKHQAQAEKAFQKYFKSSKEDTLDVLVCHGNILRYLVCRTLGIDTLKWQEIDILQCAISIVQFRSSGSNRKVLISHNEVGHIPVGLRTFL